MQFKVTIFNFNIEKLYLCACQEPVHILLAPYHNASELLDTKKIARISEYIPAPADIE